MTTKEKKKVSIVIPEPNPGEQERFVRSVKKRLIAKAGRRGGKTVGSAIKALCGFLGFHMPCLGQGCVDCDFTGKWKRMRVLYAAPTEQQVEKFWFEVVDCLSPAIETKALKKDETKHTIEVPGTEIRLKAKTAWNAQTLRGDWGDLVILEEYQMWNEDAWDNVVQPMLMDTDGMAIFVFTPPSLISEGVSKAKDPRHASKLFKKALTDTSGRWETFHWTSFDNPKISQTALKELTESGDMSPDAYRREILAQDDEIENSWLVYGNFDEEMCKIQRFEIPSTWSKISGHDFGIANPAALFVAQARLPLPEGAPKHMRAGDYVLFHEYAPGGGKSTQDHVNMFHQICPDVSYSVGGNVTTEEEIRTAYTQLGWRINAPRITRVNAQIDKVISLFEHKQLYIFSDLRGILVEIANCMWELDNEKRPMNKIQNEARYHELAALRYMGTALNSRPIWSQRGSSKIPVLRW